MLLNKTRTALFALVIVSGISSCKSQTTATETPATETQPPKQGNRPKGEAPTWDKMLAEMDQNKDGKLAKTEVKGPLQNDFAKIDLNKDGFITKEEFAKAPKPNRPPQR